MMGRSELCAWLRANSSGIYRPAADAADEIELLAAAKEQHFAKAMENGARANELRDALAALMSLPVAQQELEYLRKGIGTATPNAAWLRAEQLLGLPNGQGEAPGTARADLDR